MRKRQKEELTFADFPKFHPTYALLLLKIFSQGLDQLLEENRTADLTLIYSLFSRVKDGSTQLCTYFARFIKLTGKCIVVNPEKDPVMVQELLDFKVRMP